MPDAQATFTLSAFEQQLKTAAIDAAQHRVSASKVLELLLRQPDVAALVEPLALAKGYSVEQVIIGLQKGGEQERSSEHMGHYARTSSANYHLSQQIETTPLQTVSPSTDLVDPEQQTPAPIRLAFSDSFEKLNVQSAMMGRSVTPVELFCELLENGVPYQDIHAFKLADISFETAFFKEADLKTAKEQGAAAKMMEPLVQPLATAVAKGIVGAQVEGKEVAQEQGVAGEVKEPIGRQTAKLHSPLGITQFAGPHALA